MSPAKREGKTEPQWQQENEELRARLAEAEETLRAIREGEVDAVVVSGSLGEQVYSLTGAESVYRLIAETMWEAAFTMSLDGRILFCNRQFSSFVRTPQEQIIGRRLHEFVAPEAGREVAQLLVRSQIEPVRQRLVFQSPGGSPTPAHISTTILREPDGVSILGVATDLTELENSTEIIQQLRRREEDLQAANEELEVIGEELRTRNDQLIGSRTELDQARARYEDLFEGARRVHRDRPRRDDSGSERGGRGPSGSPGGPTEGQSVFDFPGNRGQTRLPPVHGGTGMRYEAAAQVGGEDQSGGGSAVLGGRDRGGRLRQARPHCQPARWLLRNVAARKQSEEAMRQTLEELRRSNEELRQFAYVASHDLQEPLRMVSGFLKLLEDRYKPQLDDKAREYIGYSVEGATRMQQLITDLLAYSRVAGRDQQMQPVDANKALLVALAQPAHRHRGGQGLRYARRTADRSGATGRN